LEFILSLRVLVMFNRLPSAYSTTEMQHHDIKSIRRALN
jgi:hypothetical protein